LKRGEIGFCAATKPQNRKKPYLAITYRILRRRPSQTITGAQIEESSAEIFQPEKTLLKRKLPAKSGCRIVKKEIFSILSSG
jgi:hypothetical protein